MASQQVKLSGKYLNRTCLMCSAKFHAKPSLVAKGWGKFCSRACTFKVYKTRSGEQTNSWKGDKVKYSGIHWWLKATYGNPNKCEKCGVGGKKTGRKWNIEWAKLEHKDYERKRENFWALCVKCHVSYDGRKPNKTSFKKGLIPWNKGKSTWTKEYRKQYFHDYYLTHKKKK